MLQSIELPLLLLLLLLYYDVVCPTAWPLFMAGVYSRSQDILSVFMTTSHLGSAVVTGTLNRSFKKASDLRQSHEWLLARLLLRTAGLPHEK